MMRSAEMAALPQAEQPEASAQSNIYRIAWQRKSLIILAFVIAMVLGSLYYANTPPVYKSEAKILIIRKSPATIRGEDGVTAFVEDYLTNHTQLLQSPMIVQLAVVNHDLKNLSMFQNMDPGQIIAEVITGLQVQRDVETAGGIAYGSRGSSIIALSFRGSEAGGCAAVLNAIIATYKSYLDTTYNKKSEEVVRYLESAQKDVNKKIDEIDDQKQKLIVKNPVMDIRDKQIGALRAETRAKLASVTIELAMDIRAMEIRIQTIEDSLRKSNSGAAMLLLAMEYARNFGDKLGAKNIGMEVNEKLFNLQLAKLLQQGEVGPNHPNMKALDMQIEHLQKYGQAQKANQKVNIVEAARNQLNREKPGGVGPELGAVRPGADGPPASPNSGNSAATAPGTTPPAPSTTENAAATELDEENPLIASLAAQRLELENKRRRLADLKQELENLKAEAQRDAPAELRFQALSDQKERLERQYNTLMDKVSSFDISKETGGVNAEVIFPPGPGVKVEPRALTVFILSGFLGMLAGLGLAYLADMTDKSFRSPEEIRRRLNLPVLGHIPSLLSEEEEKAKSEGVAGPDPILVTYYKSKSRKAEVFRAVRTALYFNTRGEGHKVIQITSPNMGDGKTTLSTNLAVSIAQSGKRIILVDADFRRPRIHKVFGVGSDVGFTSILTGQAELREAIQPSAVPGLSILPAGPIPPNPAELLTSPRFKELIDELREQFDFVIIDTPPLLVVTDPCVVAPRVDSVLLCIRVAKNGRPVAERAREVLTSLGANVLGVVVNGISLFGQSYGYGYSYGYQYGNYDYGTQYQYKYEYYDRYYAPYDDYYNDRDEQGNVRSPAPTALPAPAPAPAETKNGGGGWMGRMFGGKK